MDARVKPGHDGWLSFPGDAEHRTRNLEIPRCAIAHLRSGANAPSRNDVETGARSTSLGNTDQFGPGFTAAKHRHHATADFELPSAG
jgi:hypothetical protein